MAIIACQECGSSNIFFDKHTGEYACRGCGRKWGKEKEKNKYECPYCPQTFKTNKELTEHIIKEHLTLAEIEKTCAVIDSIESTFWNVLQLYIQKYRLTKADLDYQKRRFDRLRSLCTCSLERKGDVKLFLDAAMELAS